MSSACDTDVLIVGAGPAGLLLANVLGQHGIRTLVVEQLDTLIDYPRGVGMDDESLRSFQAVGLVEAVLPHTTPNQWMRFTTAKGRMFASIEPRTDVFGWPRRNAFMQPLADAVLLDGLVRFPSVEVRFSQTLATLKQNDDEVTATLTGPAGRSETVRARYLVGCDGGRSFVRKSLGIAFEGKTESTRWLVVDVADDPVGTPNLYLRCDPARPTVSIALPHGVRRFEFMVFANETDEAITAPAALQALMAREVPDPAAVRLIRSRVYTHHARLAARFRQGRVLLAGDAAHLMPVWQGQGYNSGLRDATNLGWKLAAVLIGQAGDALLDTYEQERRQHAAAMISLSVTAGRISSPTNRWVASLRDTVSLGLNLLPPARDYVTQMRFKPMPRYTQGVVLAGAPAVVGRMVPQPFVCTAEGKEVRLDDTLGLGFSLLGWGNDPGAYLDDPCRAMWRQLGARLVAAVPQTQLAEARRRLPADTVVVGDCTGRLKAWFGEQADSIVFVRPDRFVAAACSPQQVNPTTDALAKKLHANPVKEPRYASDAAVPVAQPVDWSSQPAA